MDYVILPSPSRFFRLERPMCRAVMRFGAGQRRAEKMDIPGWRLHALSGELAGHWSIRVSGNWRVTFTFVGQDAILVDYQDYH